MAKLSFTLESYPEGEPEARRGGHPGTVNSIDEVEEKLEEFSDWRRAISLASSATLAEHQKKADFLTGE